MKIGLYIDPSHCRQWMESLARRLTENHAASIHVAVSDASPLPEHVEQLFQAEEGYYHKNQRHGATPMDVCELERFHERAQPDETFDLVIDLVGDGRPPSSKESVTLLYNGHAGEKALVASIMASGMPQIALRTGTGKIVATAAPSGELAAGVTGSMDQVFARVITLIDAWIGHPHRWVQPLISRSARLPDAGTLKKRTAKSRFKDRLKQIYYRLFRPSHWRVGWRFVEDEDVWSRQSLAGETWQVLRDKETHFYADPVPWEEGGRHYLFFEDLDQRTQKGVLSVVTFDEAGKPGPVECCLEEPYHLSYPYLLRHQDQTYMIPETSANGDVALYRTEAFPVGWQREKVLLTGLDAADVTIAQWEGRWWIFCVTRDGAGGYSDCLSLFYADDLFGPWQPHAQNPVLIDKATARPAGNMIVRGKSLLRPVQDCTASYGAALKLVEVTHLSPEHYEQRVIKTLEPNSHWPGRKLHTLNRAGNLEVIDGAILRPKWSLLRWIAERIYRPKGSR
ncbi:glucosamine inositolphosphorylceramide transferase family protein [Cohaesibacter intestini]|uniref:glucosamine inositolphosphorylceramide transferase family protein n=1 Tax=Cohaesibacter intestini TaxID=2211145 RepID=UPI000DEA9660|nr:hypothetical protein [Cohaesibacter intestini]